jgi:hypothetical protein
MFETDNQETLAGEWGIRDVVFFKENKEAWESSKAADRLSCPKALANDS